MWFACFEKGQRRNRIKGTPMVDVQDNVEDNVEEEDARNAIAFYCKVVWHCALEKELVGIQ